MKDRHAFATVEFEDGRIEAGVYAEMYWHRGHAIALITETETLRLEASGLGDILDTPRIYGQMILPMTA